ncbi:MAG TPA: hypothetical protein VHL31_17030 [Geminicoccus sp.]|jgi:hypothetical protein|uniref:hypothetical protein n=1 Tax=Geminicoccus sp. TaxID=2024832 RepID=UPI002E3213D2|nr:hypothetical protein [Geminicoccus sp.]HEX2527990.1 hypothetical protein [Geminicoccus sp.]
MAVPAVIGAVVPDSWAKATGAAKLIIKQIPVVRITLLLPLMVKDIRSVARTGRFLIVKSGPDGPPGRNRNK